MQIRDEIIRSRVNPTIKWAASLLDKKGRDNAKSFVLDGEKLCYEAIQSELPITHIFICESKFDIVLPRIIAYFNDKNSNSVSVIKVDDGIIGKISSEKAPQGVITVVKYLDFFRNMDIIYKEEFFLRDDERAIALCSVRDPGNLGSVVRSAVAFGVDHIVLSADCADLYNPKTLRSAMGSLFRVKVTVVDSLGDFISSANARGRRVFAAELTKSALSLDEANITPADIVIIGNEGHGIPADISTLCNNSVYIPISKKTESLNASVAAAIFMWEQSKDK